jgi:hypothetical protein
MASAALTRTALMLSWTLRDGICVPFPTEEGDFIF